MNWKDYPNLFANGKFKVKYDSGYEKLTRRIIGIRRTLRDWVLVESEIEGKEGSCEIEYCTLIARKIDSLTAEEMKFIRFSTEPFDDRIVLRNRIAIDGLSAKYERYLLRIGVYPFSQKDFENGTVIDINTL